MGELFRSAVSVGRKGRRRGAALLQGAGGVRNREDLSDQPAPGRTSPRYRMLRDRPRPPAPPPGATRIGGADLGESIVRNPYAVRVRSGAHRRRGWVILQPRPRQTHQKCRTTPLGKSRRRSLTSTDRLGAGFRVAGHTEIRVGDASLRHDVGRRCQTTPEAQTGQEVLIAATGAAPRPRRPQGEVDAESAETMTRTLGRPLWCCLIPR